MRLGEITKDNYGQYMQLFGAKDTSALDRLHGKGKDGQTEAVGGGKGAGGGKIMTHEEAIRYMIDHGYFLEGMLHEEGDVSWHKIVDVPDEVKQKMVETRRAGIIETHDGRSAAKWGDAEGKIIHDYVKTLKPEDRAPAAWTLMQAAQDEGKRIGDFLLSKMPSGWYFNGVFDPKILTGTNWGLDDPGANRHIDVYG